MARLTKIGVGGFKSIKDLQPFDLRPANILIGANGAGKSNLIEFLRLLGAIPGLKLQEVVGRAGGPDSLLYYGVKQTRSMWISLEFEAKTGRGLYLFSLVTTATDALVFSGEEVEYRVTKGSEPKRFRLGSGHKESVLLEGENHFHEIWDLLAGIQIFHFADTSETAAIRRRGYIEDNRYLHNDGRNLAAFLLKLQSREPLYYQRIVKAIRQIAPFFDDFELRAMETDPASIMLNWKDRDSEHLFGPHQLSDGTLRAMALAALLGQPEAALPGLVVLDEPEIGLHPYAIEILSALLKGAAVHRPIIVATQSVALVNQFSPEDVVTVTRDNAQSKFARQDSESLSAWLADYTIGDLWEKNLIGGTPSR
jgi:predicted ATPase